MAPLVTIGIATFDRLHYLKESVESALAQTYDNIEVIIGDDGTNYSIQQWGNKLAGQDERARYQHNSHNLGLAGNWNAIADAAHGEFIVIIGDDDRLLPGFVRKMVDVILPDFQVAFSNHYLIDTKGDRLQAKSVEHTRNYRRDTLPPGELANAAASVWQNLVPMSAALVRTEVIRRLRFREDLNTPETELFVRLAQEGGRFIFVPDYLSEYRVHSQSQTSAGLYSERLAEYLLPISVAPDVEPFKREFIGPLLVNAVSRCLQNGERESARRFLRSEYYPRPRLRIAKPTYKTNGTKVQVEGLRSASAAIELKYVISCLVQEACTRLPAFMGRPIYRAIQRIKSAFESLIR